MLLRRPDLRRLPRRAFTLMEVLIVVAIIVVLAGIATVSFRYLSDAKTDATKVRIRKIETAVGSYKLRYGQFPDNLNALLQPPDGAQAYVEQGDILDEWGQQLHMDASQLSPTGKPKIWSNGEP